MHSLLANDPDAPRLNANGTETNPVAKAALAGDSSILADGGPCTHFVTTFLCIDNIVASQGGKGATSYPIQRGVLFYFSPDRPFI